MGWQIRGEMNHLNGLMGDVSLRDWLSLGVMRWKTSVDPGFG